MAKANMSRNDLIEFAAYLLEGVRDERYRELLGEWRNDQSIEKALDERRSNPGERVVVEG